jgi:hypothetical protein
MMQPGIMQRPIQYAAQTFQPVQQTFHMPHANIHILAMPHEVALGYRHPLPAQSQIGVRHQQQQQTHWSPQVAGRMPMAPQGEMLPQSPAVQQRPHMQPEMMHRQPSQPQNGDHDQGYVFRHDGYHNKWGNDYRNGNGNDFGGASQ